jgi:hypothetical protein
MALTWTYVDGINAVGAPIDWEAFKEIKDNVDLVDAKAGTDVDDSLETAGPSGQAVTIPDQGDTDYIPVIAFLTDDPGSIGEWSITRDSSTQFTLYNSGIAGIDFAWKVIR